LHQQLSAAKSALAVTPDDPARLLDLAAAIIQLHERTGHGDLDEAISASRKAAKAHTWPGSSMALFWEAAAHAQVGRPSRARDRVREFTARAKNVKRWKQHIREAERRMRELPPA
jgi:hypothetical protein